MGWEQGPWTTALTGGHGGVHKNRLEEISLVCSNDTRSQSGEGRKRNLWQRPPLLHWYTEPVCGDAEVEEKYEAFKIYNTAIYTKAMRINKTVYRICLVYQHTS